LTRGFVQMEPISLGQKPLQQLSPIFKGMDPICNTKTNTSGSVLVLQLPFAIFSGAVRPLSMEGMFRTQGFTQDLGGIGMLLMLSWQ